MRTRARCSRPSRLILLRRSRPCVARAYNRWTPRMETRKTTERVLTKSMIRHSRWGCNRSGQSICRRRWLRQCCRASWKSGIASRIGWILLTRNDLCPQAGRWCMSRGHTRSTTGTRIREAPRPPGISRRLLLSQCLFLPSKDPSSPRPNTQSELPPRRGLL